MNSHDIFSLGTGGISITDPTRGSILPAVLVDWRGEDLVLFIRADKHLVLSKALEIKGLPDVGCQNSVSRPGDDDRLMAHTISSNGVIPPDAWDLVLEAVALTGETIDKNYSNTVRGQIEEKLRQKANAAVNIKIDLKLG